MKILKRMLHGLRRKLAVTPEQAEHLATIKFPCC